MASCGSLYIVLAIPAILLTEATIVEHAFSTKTAYGNCALRQFEDSTAASELGNCNLIHTSALFRHGSRSPSTKEVEAFRDFFNRVKDSALQRTEGAQPPEGFLSYPVPFEHSRDELELLQTGFNELHELGGRIRKKAETHKFEYNLENTKIYSTSVNRARDSASAFFNGLFGLGPWYDMLHRCKPSSTTPECRPDGYKNFKDFETNMLLKIVENDHMLRFFDYCPRYQVSVNKNKTAFEQVEIFKKSKVMRDLLNDMVKKYKLGSGFTTGDLHTLYLACSYEVAFEYPSKSNSPWCQFLDTKSLYALEYMEDLKHYWRNSYPYMVSYIQACPLLNAILEKMKDAALSFKSGNKNPIRGTFWFGHAETVLPYTALLGLFNDSIGSNTLVTLTAESGFQRREELLKKPTWPPNMFRAGFIAPFAANIEFDLHQCPHKTGTDMEFIVQLLVNGRSVAWPLAGSTQPPTLSSPGGVATSLKRLLDAYKFCSPAEYNSTAFCSLPSAASAALLSKVRLLASLISVHFAAGLLRLTI